MLKKLLQNQLYVKAKKFEFHQHNISFLGYIIRPGGFAIDQDKVKVVVE